ncbi:short chain dehydrogenase reductase [Xylariaceae sp. FL1019]|nr:short chain dehydrogenase reductase [Xylariaceae sp. FL1019]
MNMRSRLVTLRGSLLESHRSSISLLRRRYSQYPPRNFAPLLKSIGAPGAKHCRTLTTSIAKYEDQGAIDLGTPVDLTKLAGKSVVITGGAKGLGLAYVKAFVAAGAFVTVGDWDEITGNTALAEHAPNTKFVKCDVRDWDSQVDLFEAAIAASPSKGIDVVLSNAGVFGSDDMATFQDPSGPPEKPDLRTLEVNLMGSLYTAKLAMHYFRRHDADDPSRDRCLVIKGSLSAYLDQPGFVQYNTSKFGSRGLFRSLRRTSWTEGIRVNFVAPWYVRTPLLSAVSDYLDSQGVNYASAEDCAEVVLNIASNRTMNGRAIGIVPREQVSKGYLDLALDDYKEGEVIKEFQDIVLRTSGL